MQNQSSFYINELKSYFQQQDKDSFEFEETIQTLKSENQMSYNDCIFNSQNRYQQNFNEIKQQKKTKIFNQVIKKFRETESQLLVQKQYDLERDLRLSQILLISTEGIIRTNKSVIQLSFGYLYKALVVKFLKQQYIVEVQYEQTQPIHQISLEKAQNDLLQTPCQYIQQSYYVLQSIYEQKRNLRNYLDSLQITQDLIQLHNQQLNQFMQKQGAFIQQYNEQNDGAIFQYFIRKINLKTKAEEIAKVGYSMSFLELIGASVDKFCSIILINQKLDLVQNSQEILNQNLNGVSGYFQNNFAYTNSSKLITLDGFCLSFSYSIEHINLSEKFQLNQQLPFKQTITITKIHVDIQELQNIVSFRLASLRQKRNLSVQELLNLCINSAPPNESQMFIQKYYEQKIKEIYKQQTQHS
ncbi:hypothetical protein ABPG72_018971 [Tetrahymena utriculariae]